MKYLNGADVYSLGLDSALYHAGYSTCARMRMEPYCDWKVVFASESWEMDTHIQSYSQILAMDSDCGWLQQSTIDKQCDIEGGGILLSHIVTGLSHLHKTNFKLQKVLRSHVYLKELPMQ